MSCKHILKFFSPPPPSPLEGLYGGQQENGEFSIFVLSNQFQGRISLVRFSSLDAHTLSKFPEQLLSAKRKVRVRVFALRLMMNVFFCFENTDKTNRFDSDWLTRQRQYKNKNIIIRTNNTKNINMMIRTSKVITHVYHEEAH